MFNVKIRLPHISQSKMAENGEKTAKYFKNLSTYSKLLHERFPDKNIPTMADKATAF